MALPNAMDLVSQNTRYFAHKKPCLPLSVVRSCVPGVLIFFKMDKTFFWFQQEIRIWAGRALMQFL